MISAMKIDVFQHMLINIRHANYSPKHLFPINILHIMQPETTALLFHDHWMEQFERYISHNYLSQSTPFNIISLCHALH